MDTLAINRSCALTQLAPLLAFSLLACESDGKPRTTVVTDGNATSTDNVLASICDGKSDGTACMGGRHCVRGDCMFNECGDGVRADDELCDDGNSVLGDGCSPGCAPEYVKCDGGVLVNAAEGCNPAGDADAGVEEPGECLKAKIKFPKGTKRVRASGNGVLLPPKAYAEIGIDPGGTITFEAVEPDGATFLWYTEIYPADAVGRVLQAVTYDYLLALGGPSSAVLCPDEQLADEIIVTLTRFAPGCAPSEESFGVACRYPVELTPPPPPDPGQPDAGAGGVQDASVDASSGDGDSASVGDAGDAGIAKGFRSPACEACVRSNCGPSYVEGFDFAGACLDGIVADGGIDAPFAKACSDAFHCSANSPDNCGHKGSTAPAACLCGDKVSIENCQAAAGNILGTCKAEWFAATRCPVDEKIHTCATGEFDNLSLPSGFAKGLNECQRELCRVECPPPTPGEI